MYSVYKHTTPSGKVYIGVTGKDPKYRWHNGNGYRGQLFDKAIKKYGWDNIQHEIIYENLTAEEAFNLEIIEISRCKSNNPKYGYNCSLGGEQGSHGYKMTELTKKKMSDSRKGHIVSEITRKKIGEANKISLKGRHLSEEHKQKLSISLKGKPHTEEHNKKVSMSNLGKKRTAETLQKLRDSHLGYKMPNSQKTKISIGTKRFWDNLSVEQRKEIAKKSKQNCSSNISVVLFSNNDNFEKVFNTCAECARFLGVSPALICKKLKTPNATIKGFYITKAKR